MKNYLSVARHGHFLSKSHYLSRRRLTLADRLAILSTRLLYWRDNVTHGLADRVGLAATLARRLVRPVREVRCYDLREMLREAFKREHVEI